MKLTDAPPSTQSISRWASSWSCASVSPLSGRTAGNWRGALFMGLSPIAGLADDHDRVARRFFRAVVEGGGAIDDKRQAVARLKMVPVLADAHVDRSVQHPYLLMHA